MTLPSAPPPLRLGYKASAEQFAPADLLSFGVAAERLGLDSVAVSDHFQPFRHDGGHSPASLPWLGALVAQTSRVLVGTSVLTPTYRYHPAVVAQAFATLGCLAPGRVFLGLGSGEAMNEVAPTGVDWPGAGERLERLREAVALIRRLWSGDQVHFEGQWYRTGGAVIYDLPEQPIPVWIAAGGPKGARFAGAEGGLITTSGKPLELYSERLLPNAAAGAEEAGVDPDRHRAADRDQALLREGSRHRRQGLPLLGAARAARRVQAGRRRPARARAPRRRARRRAGRLALHLHERSRRGRRAHQALPRPRLPPPRLPQPGARPARLPRALRRRAGPAPPRRPVGVCSDETGSDPHECGSDPHRAGLTPTVRTRSIRLSMRFLASIGVPPYSCRECAGGHLGDAGDREMPCLVALRAHARCGARSARSGVRPARCGSDPIRACTMGGPGRATAPIPLPGQGSREIVARIQPCRTLRATAARRRSTRR